MYSGRAQGNGGEMSVGRQRENAESQSSGGGGQCEPRKVFRELGKISPGREENGPWEAKSYLNRQLVSANAGMVRSQTAKPGKAGREAGELMREKNTCHCAGKINQGTYYRFIKHLLDSSVE